MVAENPPGLFQRIIKSFLKFFFKLLYHQFAWTYDWVADIVSLGHWRSWVYSPIPFLGDVKVLELGCGPGHLQLALRRKEISSFGLDSSKQMVNLAAYRLSRNSQPINIIQGETQNLPFPDFSFDKLVATFPSDYIFDSETLSQAWRVLNASGELIILPAAWITGNTLLDRCAAWLFRVTGQVPIKDLLEVDEDAIFPLSSLRKSGFQIRSEIIELESSKLLLIRAIKGFSDSH